MSPGISGLLPYSSRRQKNFEHLSRKSFDNFFFSDHPMLPTSGQKCDKPSRGTTSGGRRRCGTGLENYDTGVPVRGATYLRIVEKPTKFHKTNARTDPLLESNR